MSKPIVSLVNVEKWYGTNHVVKNMNINIAEGEFLTLLGPSGCGKTTTLRMISGFVITSIFFMVSSSYSAAFPINSV